jgi:endonuclease YncB( thermonuclease family)
MSIEMILSKDWSVLSVYDGSTINIRVPAWPEVFGYKLPLRIRGYNTPIVKGGNIAGAESRNYLEELLKPTPGKRIAMSRIRRSKFFRIVATIKIDGVDVAEIMVKAGHGVLYGPEQETQLDRSGC